MRPFMLLVVPLLALVGIGTSVVHYFQPPYNPGFMAFPPITAAHVVLGAVFLALAPFQFVRALRRRGAGYRRWAGRLLVAIGLVVGATALFLGLVVPFAGNPERVVIGVFGAIFLVALARGYADIRAGHVAAHREWMIRAFAIGLSIATMRLLFVPSLMLVDDPTETTVAALSTGSFAASFVIHTLVAEHWIRRTRPSANRAGGTPMRRAVGLRSGQPRIADRQPAPRGNRRRGRPPARRSA